MPDISSIGHGQVGPVDRASSVGDRRESTATGPSAAPPPERPGDRVELSDHARFLDRLRRLPDVRETRVQAVRDEIANGTYETEDRLDAAIDRLLQDL